MNLNCSKIIFQINIVKFLVIHVAIKKIGNHIRIYG
jgi:hypothetical protein